MKVNVFFRICGFEEKEFITELELPENYLELIKNDYKTSEPPRVREEMTLEEYIADDLNQQMEIHNVQIIG